MANATVDGAKQFFSSYARSLLAKVDVSLPFRDGGQIIERDVSSGAERVVVEQAW